MIYAFIPARSGSKRLKDKNYLMLKDKRLFEWSIECANNTEKIEKIIFSTDSNKYIEYAKSIRLDKELIIDYRSDLNSSSETKIFDYLKSDFIKNNTYLNKNDSLLMLLPTQPFRVNKDIDEIIKLGEKTKKNVFSSREYSFHVSFAFKFLENGQFESLLKDSPMITGNTRSQEQTKYYHPDGSVYFLNMTSLMNDSGPSIYINAIPFKSSSKYFIDIDDQSDLEYARFIADLF